MSNYQSHLEKLEDLAREFAEKQCTFFQHILLVASSSLGILISLHPTTPVLRYSRWGFLLSVILLGLAVASGTITLYSQTKLVDRARQAFADECVKSLEEKRPPKMVTVAKTRIHVFCEKATYILLSLGWLCLCAYAVCRSYGI